MPLAHGTETGEDRWAYSELNNEGNITGTFWVRKGDWKYVCFVDYPPLLFNLKDDPGEFENLAGIQKYREVERELHDLLRSVVDPEKVSAEAFAHQKARLEKDLARLDDPEIYRRYSSRLGEEFAAKLKAGI